MVRLLGHLGGQLNRSLVTGCYVSAAIKLIVDFFFKQSVLVNFACLFCTFLYLTPAVSAEDMMKRFVAWDCEKRLSFAVPFKDIKPVIYLDSFLPRVTELALSSSDRQTKVRIFRIFFSLLIKVLTVY